MDSRTLRRGAATLLGALALGATAAAPAAEILPAPYAGQQTRSIKSLSEEERSALLTGQGSGFAKAAELNGYPGPAHVLELAAQLGLDPTQHAATRALMSEHRQRARALGAELLAAEAELDLLFAGRQARATTVDETTQKVGSLHARLRAEHLKTHLAEMALLTPSQVERYAVLRGYRSDLGNPAPPAAGHPRDAAHQHH